RPPTRSPGSLRPPLTNRLPTEDNPSGAAGASSPWKRSRKSPVRCAATAIVPTADRRRAVASGTGLHHAPARTGAAPVPEVRDPALSIGSIFAGSYEVLAPLGEGSFGRVYKGRQRSTGQAVAIKTLPLRQGGAARDT